MTSPVWPGFATLTMQVCTVWEGDGASGAIVSYQPVMTA